jgi:hypothetical protein
VHAEHTSDMSFAVSDMRKIGIGLTAFGLAFTGLGVVMLFDKGMLGMGNVLFLAGVMMIIGPQRSVRFFFQKKKASGSLFFFAGMALVLIGVPIIGMIAEAWGFVNLFGDFFPIAISFMRRLPVVGNLLNMAPVKKVRVRRVKCLPPHSMRNSIARASWSLTRACLLLCLFALVSPLCFRASSVDVSLLTESLAGRGYPCREYIVCPGNETAICLAHFSLS